MSGHTTAARSAEDPEGSSENLEFVVFVFGDSLPRAVFPELQNPVGKTFM